MNKRKEKLVRHYTRIPIEQEEWLKKEAKKRKISGAKLDQLIYQSFVSRLLTLPK